MWSLLFFLVVIGGLSGVFVLYGLNAGAAGYVLFFGLLAGAVIFFSIVAAAVAVSAPPKTPPDPPR